VRRLSGGHRSAAQAEASRAVQGGVDFHIGDGGLQPGAHAGSDSDCLCGLIGS
jgi:hypothetical protein